ncbi:MAG: hypothetical protein ABJL67_11625 [Sulfitobacter sp.]
MIAGLDFWRSYYYDERVSKMMRNNKKLNEARNLQAIESNPLSAVDIAMFEVFERKGLSPAQRRAHILGDIDTIVPSTE